MHEDVKAKLAQLENKLIDPELQKDQPSLIKLAQEHAALKKTVNLILAWEKIKQEITQNQEIIKLEPDSELATIAQEELIALQKKADELSETIEEEINPASPNDKKNAIIEIRAGTGGDEAALFAGDLFRMYSHFCENRGWKTELINSSSLGIGGYKEIIFAVKGENAYGLLKYEAGTHRVQRVPETEKQGRVHTSTATVVVLPEAEEVDIEIKPNEIRIDTFCSSGPGGQSVNTTYSAIRILHIPTGLIVSCQDQKSQHQNREKALQVLRSRLLARQEEERLAQESSDRKSQVGAGDRADKIRTYNFPQDRVTDHRINTSWHNITDIMEGAIEEIITELKKAAKNKIS
ncbi:MAG: peptide chain release factor 1 [Patescibacteria group bacterium]|jgi:peptide chain release factor 1|nr:peptide chain release factor 1 [bacterium]HQC50128.1 peptide chain release factor 1 [bacterium]